MEKEQWGKADGANVIFPTTAAIQKTPEFELGKITTEEVRAVVRKMKRQKAAGPDELPMELFKSMNEASMEQVAAVLHQWWEDEVMPAEALQARVATIFKKGDSSKMENYSPISLLNSI